MNVQSRVSAEFVKYCQLGDIVEFRNEIVHPHEKPKGKAVFVGLEHIERDTGIRLGSTKIDLAEMGGRRARFYSGDIVYGYLRPYLNKVWIAEFDGLCSVDQYVLKINAAHDRNYVAHFLRSEKFLETAPIASAPGQLPRIRSGEIAQTPIPLPSLDEQRRIASILDKADALRRKRRHALALLNELSRSIFCEVFGDPALNPRSYPLQTLRNVSIKISDGPFGSNLKSEHYVEEGIRVIRLQNIGSDEFLDEDRAYISSEHFSSLSKHECLPGDVLVATLGEPNLRACLQPLWLDRALNKADCVQIRVDPLKVNPRYISALINHPSVERMAQNITLGQTRLRISMGRLRDLPLPIAPLEDQKKFADQIYLLSQLRLKAEREVEGFETLFSSLQSRAFSGQL